MEGITDRARRLNLPLQVSGYPAAFHTCFSQQPIHDYASYQRTDQKRLAAFIGALLQRGIRPTSRGTWFLSTAHTDQDIESTLAAVDSALSAAGG
jgi:glutamate-1-semialdehyde 2,1-aminomutase